MQDNAYNEKCLLSTICNVTSLRLSASLTEKWETFKTIEESSVNMIFLTYSITGGNSEETTKGKIISSPISCPSVTLRAISPK